jgi:hypothetical protein
MASQAEKVTCGLCFLRVQVCGYSTKEIFYSVWKETINKNVDLQVTNCLICLAAFVKEKSPGDDQ